MLYTITITPIGVNELPAIHHTTSKNIALIKLAFAIGRVYGIVALKVDEVDTDLIHITSTRGTHILDIAIEQTPISALPMPA